MNIVEILNKNNIEWQQIGNEIVINCPFCEKTICGNPVATFHIDQEYYRGNCNNKDCLKIADWKEIFEKLEIKTEIQKEHFEEDKNNTLQKDNEQKYQFTSIGKLLNEPEENKNWVVDEMLPTGGFSIMVAKPKVGKSTLVRQLALCVSKGESFLEKKTEKGRVLYVAFEEKRNEVKNHFKLLGANGEENLGIYVGSVPEDANNWLEEEVRREHPILIIIDTLFRFAQVTDVNDYAKVTKILNPLLNLSRDNNTHLMCLHHARKMGGDGADATLGSTAIFGTVDTAILLKRGNNNKRTIETQQRYGKDMEETVLEFDLESKNITIGNTKEEEDIKKINGEILDFLKMIKEPITEETINKETEGKTSLKRKALRELVERKEISRTGEGRKGNPYLYSCSLVPDICVKQEKQITIINPFEESFKK